MCGRRYDLRYKDRCAGWPLHSLDGSEGKVVFNDYNSRAGVLLSDTEAESKGKAMATMLGAPFASIDLCTVGFCEKMMQCFPAELSQQLHATCKLDPMTKVILEMDKQYDDKIRQLCQADPGYWPEYCHWADSEPSMVALWDVAVIAVLAQVASPRWEPLVISTRLGTVRAAFDWQEGIKLGTIWHEFVDCLTPSKTWGQKRPRLDEGDIEGDAQ